MNGGEGCGGVKLSGNGFGRDYRLRSLSQLSTVRAGGISRAGQYCVLNVLIPPPDGSRRAAFSISRRYSGLAVERNRARRLFREVYRRIYAEYPEMWVIFVPRKRIRKAKMQDVLSEVEVILAGLGITRLDAGEGQC